MNYDAEGYLLCNKTWTDVDLNLREGLLLSVDCTKLHNSTYISLTLSYETTPYMVCLLFRYDLDKQVLFLIRSYNDYELNRFESITGYDDNLFLIGQNLNGTVLIRMDAEGSQLWSYSLSYGNSKSMIASHNYLYIIESIESDKSRFDLSLLKFDTDGNLIWNKTWGGVGIYPLNQSAIISISMTKQQFYLDESLNVIISILNNGTANISFYRCCFTYILERNGTLIELFFPYNNTNEVILPGSVFTETIDLREYSSDIDTWEAIGNLGVGNYSLYAIYGCINNPWYNETDFPYNMSTSNVLQFEILENPVGNSNWTIVLIISTIILLTIVSSLVWLNRQRRQKT
ncbi:MAG: hypothetical protein FP824_05525 [Euryarchaeota archaeon]|nr:hypothetical protein [Euryarchaeota archaeon]